jgi:predicted amidophosphoribosyltransferase
LVVKPDEVARRNIILLDDVTTSGATLGEAARTLKAAGARKIVGLTAAKA